MRSELYLNDISVPLTDEINAAITYQISDIRFPQNKNGSYSKTIKLPGSKTLNQLLDGIFDVSYITQTSGVVNFTPDFNPNLKCKAVLYIDGIEQFRGYMRLININRIQSQLGKIEYEVVLFGETANIFVALGEKKLTDLDWASLDHTYNKPTQQATWTATTYGTGYVYPMINYGGVNANTWDVNNFFPATYYKEIIDKIFNYAGYSYRSTFLDSSYFKHLIIPFNGDKLTITATQQQDRLFAASTASQTSGTCNATTSYSLNPVIYGTEISDPGNQYDPTTGIFTATNSGYYTFYTSGVVKLDAVTTVHIGSSGILAFYDVGLYQYRGATLINNYPTAGQVQAIGGTYTSGQTIRTFTYAGGYQSIYLIAGDTVKVRLTAGFQSNSAATGTIGIVHKTGAVFYNQVTNTNIIDGNSLLYSQAIPQDVKCRDFLAETLKLFNLYVQTDKNNPYSLIIDSYENFYSSGVVRDWTDKVDISQPFVQQPMGALDASRFRFKWSEDADKWNKYYKDKWNETFGEKYIDVNTDFVKNTITLESFFAGTPIIGSVAHDRIIPEIYSENSSGSQIPIKAKLRVLYWSGALSCVNSWTYTSSVSGSSTESTYPYAGHVDNPYIPTYDINLGVPREIYYVNPYGTTQYTDDNIYNRFHRQYYDEITDANSKIITLYAWLKPIDIFNLDFRDKIWIDGHYFRLNKIMDYDPVANKPTKIELLKIKAGVPYTRTLADLTWTYGGTIGRDTTPTGGLIDLTSLGTATMGVTVGRGNTIVDNSDGSIIAGSTNRIGANTSNVAIFASSGVVVAAGLHNVSVIGTNDVTINQNDTVYINGTKYALGNTSIFQVNTDYTARTAGTYFINSSVTVTLNSNNLEIGDNIHFFNMDSNVTISGGGVNIIYASNQSASSYTMTHKYESITLTYTGSNYIIRTLNQ